MSEAMDLFKKWTERAEELEAAVAARDYAGFKKAFREGTKYFNEIKKLIVENGQGKKEMTAAKDIVSKAVARWRNASAGVPEWMIETKAIIKKKQASKANDKKLGDAYKFMKKTGLNLKVKAR